MGQRRGLGSGGRQSIEISEVKYDFDPETIAEGDFDITFATKGRIFKIHTTDFQEEGKKVDLKFAAGGTLTSGPRWGV